MKLSEYKKPPGQDWSEYVAVNGCVLFLMAIFILAGIGIVMTFVAWILGVFGYTIVPSST